MDNTVLQLILGAILGAIASYFFPLMINYFIVNKTKQKVLGPWKSTWKPKVDNATEWVVEDIEIRKSFFQGLRFTASNNSGGYDWCGNAKITDKRYISGEWESTNEAAYACGAFILTIAARGNFMFGYDVAPDEGGTIRYREFVLGRTDEDLEKGKDWLMMEMDETKNKTTANKK